MNKFHHKLDRELVKIERELEKLADHKGYDIDHDEQYIQACKRATDIVWGDELSTDRAWLEIAMAYGQVKERIEKFTTC